MKPICLSIVLYLLWPLSGHPNPQENAEAVLMEEVALQEDQQQLKAQLNEKNKKEVTLIGQVRATSIPTQRHSKVVQVVWTALQAKDKKRAVFKEPLISTFKSGKGSLSKGLKISLYGNKAHLSEALTRLEKGEDDQISEIKADNLSSNERRLEDVDEQVKKRASLRNTSDLGTPIEENSFHDHTSLSASTESYRGSSASSYGERKNADSLIRKPSNNQNNLSTISPSSSLRGGSRGSHLKSSPSSSMSEATPSKPGLQNDKNKAHLEDKSFEGTLLHSSPNSKASSQSLHPGFEGSLDDSFDPLKINQGDSSGLEEFKMPLIEVEITKEGCRPTIDLERGKVIVQTRSMTRKDGTLVSETLCADSDLIFDIKKDYGCCSDKVDEGTRAAYTTFRRYYLDEGYNKVYVDAECIKDESQSHPFIEEKGNCRHEIHLQSRLAYPQREIVYYDRSHARKVVKGCHRSNAQPLTITSTAEGCPLKHVYEQNKSLIQKKEVFVDHGVTHEVVPCHETEESLPHNLVKADCKPLINGSQVTPMAKRQVIHKGKKKIINDQCEPQDLTQLQTTRIGCEGQYEHDFDSGRSYPLARHYYEWKGKNLFIDKMCRRSNQVLDHLREIVGYEHLDLELKSKPRYQVSIQDQAKKHIIQEMTENSKDKWVAYTLKEAIERPSQKRGHRSQGSNVIFETDKIEVWIRPDGTVFEKIIGVGNTLSISMMPNDGSGKTIVSVTEQCRDVFNWSQRVHGNPYGGRVDYHVRKLTKYSDGSVKVGGWEIRVAGDSAEYYANNLATRNLFGTEPALPPGIMYRGGD